MHLIKQLIYRWLISHYAMETWKAGGYYYYRFFNPEASSRIRNLLKNALTHIYHVTYIDPSDEAIVRATSMAGVGWHFPESRETWVVATRTMIVGSFAMRIFTRENGDKVLYNYAPMLTPLNDMNEVMHWIIRRMYLMYPEIKFVIGETSCPYVLESAHMLMRDPSRFFVPYMKPETHPDLIAATTSTLSRVENMHKGRDYIASSLVHIGLRPMHFVKVPKPMSEVFLGLGLTRQTIEDEKHMIFYGAMGKPDFVPIIN